MPWIWSVLMPHPPILVPEVGRGREAEAAETPAEVMPEVEVAVVLHRQVLYTQAEEV